MNEKKKREPRLILPETDELAAVYEDGQESSIAIIGLGNGDYVASMAKAWRRRGRSERDKRELVRSARARLAGIDRSPRPESDPVIGIGGCAVDASM